MNRLWSLLFLCCLIPQIAIANRAVRICDQLLSPPVNAQNLREMFRKWWLLTTNYDMGFPLNSIIHSQPESFTISDLRQQIQLDPQLLPQFHKDGSIEFKGQPNIQPMGTAAPIARQANVLLTAVPLERRKRSWASPFGVQQYLALTRNFLENVATAPPHGTLVSSEALMNDLYDQLKIEVVRSFAIFVASQIDPNLTSPFSRHLQRALSTFRAQQKNFPNFISEIDVLVSSVSGSRLDKNRYREQLHSFMENGMHGSEVATALVTQNFKLTDEFEVTLKSKWSVSYLILPGGEKIYFSLTRRSVQDVIPIHLEIRPGSLPRRGQARLDGILYWFLVAVNGLNEKTLAP